MRADLVANAEPSEASLRIRFGACYLRRRPASHASGVGHLSERVLMVVEIVADTGIQKFKGAAATEIRSWPPVRPDPLTVPSRSTPRTH